MCALYTGSGSRWSSSALPVKTNCPLSLSLTVLVYWTQVELYQSNRKRTYTYPGRDGVALTVLGSIAAPDIRLSSSCPGDPIGNVGAGRYARPLITSKRGSSVPR